MSSVHRGDRPHRPWASASDGENPPSSRVRANL